MKAVPLGEEAESGDKTDGTIDVTGIMDGISNQNSRPSLGARADKRPPGEIGAHRAPKSNSDEKLLSCVTLVVEKCGMMADSFARDAKVESEQIGRVEIERALAGTTTCV